MLTKKTWIIALSGIALLLAFFPTYYVNSMSGGDLLWHSDEAYLFLEVNSLGYRVSYLEYPFQAFREYFGLGRRPDDKHSYTVVLRITPSTVQRYRFDGVPLEFYTPFNQVIYGNREGVLWKWAGDHFEEGSADEQREHRGFAHLSASPFTDVDGWSARREIGSQGTKVRYEIAVGGKQLALVADPGPENKALSIDLLRPGQPPERIWNLNQDTRRISKSEYQALFEQP